MSFKAATAPGRVFETREALLAHYQTDWHRYNLKRKAAGLAPIDEALHARVALAAQAKPVVEKKRDHLKRPDDEGDEREFAPKIEYVIDEGELLHYEVNLRKSMFCDDEFDSLESNLTDMYRRFGFYVPYDDIVVDLEGLLTYLVKKINVGRLCMFCHKQFSSSPKAVLDHMRDSGHRKMSLCDEEDVDEFEDFYDSVELFKRVIGGVDAAANIDYDDVTGELVVTADDGSKKILGSKRFMRIYSQADGPSLSSNIPSKGESAKMSDSRALTAALERQGGSALSTFVYKPKHVMTREQVATRKTVSRLAQRMRLADSIKQNLLVKDRVAGKNMGAGFGVHG